MTLNIYTFVGFVGALVVVLAYWANQADRLPSHDWRFPAANLGGSILILVSLYDAWNWPSVVIELFWATISIYGLLRARAAQ
ncbi:MAG: CBU_0592 family membrane protein [Rhizomicrobium sp.]